MAEEHARARVSHHLADALAHLGLIAMDGAVGAGGLFVAKRAAVQAALGVTSQLVTAWAKRRSTTMLTAAVDLNHGADGPPFPQQAGGLGRCAAIRLVHGGAHLPSIVSPLVAKNLDADQEPAGFSYIGCFRGRYSPVIPRGLAEAATTSASADRGDVVLVPMLDGLPEKGLTR
jgi:hypothetical protein